MFSETAAMTLLILELTGIRGREIRFHPGYRITSVVCGANVLAVITNRLSLWSEVCRVVWLRAVILTLHCVPALFGTDQEKLPLPDVAWGALLMVAMVVQLLPLSNVYSNFNYRKVPDTLSVAV